MINLIASYRICGTVLENCKWGYGNGMERVEGALVWGRGSEEFVRKTSEPRECLLMSPVGRVNKSPALLWVS